MQITLLVLCLGAMVVLGFLAFYISKSLVWSSVTVKQVADGDKSEGVPFYEPRPYLLVTKTEAKDASGKLTTAFTNQIIWLPDRSRQYKVQVKSGWGTVSGSVKLQNGWMLDTFGAQTDSKMPETIAAVGGLVTKAITKALEPTSPESGLTEGLYLIEFDPQTGTAVSLKKVSLKKVQVA